MYEILLSDCIADLKASLPIGNLHCGVFRGWIEILMVCSYRDDTDQGQ